MRNHLLSVQRQAKTVVHFHANPECVLLKETYFDPSSLSIPEEVLVTLSPANKVYIAQYFGKIIS